MPTLAFLATGTDEAFGVILPREEADGKQLAPPITVSRQDFAATVQRLEDQYSPRWVISRTANWMSALLEADVHLAKAHVLDLAQRILHRSPFVSQRLPDVELDERAARPAQPGQDMLFAEPSQGEDLPGLETRYLQQRQALPIDAQQRHRLQLLLRAESIGAVIAAEMEHAGLAWDANAHRALLREQLGARVPEGVQEPKLAELATELGQALHSPGLNPDSPQELLRALQRAGYPVGSVRAWELEQHRDPVINLVLHYKHLSRLASTHGDAWLDQWVRDARFHPHYVLGTVASGRWAATGGGALQLPHDIRQVITAPAGRVFVVADGRQLEPRILAAISGDAALQQAGQDADLYQAFVDAGVAASRADAKLGMLSAIYGGSSAMAAGVVSALERNFPRAMEYVSQAARAGEQGQGVHSWLGRGCPPASEEWVNAQRHTADAAAQAAADAAARSRGRFTRNFVVQSTAAEWALVWMAHTRHLIYSAGLHTRCRQVFFVHDELVFETEEALAEGLSHAIRQGARQAGQTLFGQHSPDFPVSVATVKSYADAK